MKEFLWSRSFDFLPFLSPFISIKQVFPPYVNSSVHLTDGTSDSTSHQQRSQTNDESQSTLLFPYYNELLLFYRSPSAFSKVIVFELKLSTILSVYGGVFHAIQGPPPPLLYRVLDPALATAHVQSCVRLDLNIQGSPRHVQTY